MTKPKTHPTVQVRRATKVKVERIARANRWSLVETIDALADAYNASRPAAPQPTAPRSPDMSPSAA
jgi:hypothetical protein